MTELESTLTLLLEQHGLRSLLKQNDIEELFILEYMFNEALIDLDDYLYTDVPQYVLEMEE